MHKEIKLCLKNHCKRVLFLFFKSKCKCIRNCFLFPTEFKVIVVLKPQFAICIKFLYYNLKFDLDKIIFLIINTTSVANSHFCIHLQNIYIRMLTNHIFYNAIFYFQINIVYFIC